MGKSLQESHNAQEAVQEKKTPYKYTIMHKRQCKKKKHPTSIP